MHGYVVDVPLSVLVDSAMRDRKWIRDVGSLVHQSSFASAQVSPNKKRLLYVFICRCTAKNLFL